MARFVVELTDGSYETVFAASGDEDDESDGYVFFVDDQFAIVGVFHKSVVKSWGADPNPTVGASDASAS